MLLTRAEALHWATYYKKDWQTYLDTDEFWNSIMTAYKNKDLPLPLLPNTQTIWKAIKRFKCIENCGGCCHYGIVPVTAYDVKRLSDNGIDLEKTIWSASDGSAHLNASPDCQFLKDNKCTIYNIRPECCFVYPLQLGTKEQLRIRIFCKPTLDLARKIVIDAMKEGGKIIFPDLTIIQEV